MLDIRQFPDGGAYAKAKIQKTTHEKKTREQTTNPHFHQRHLKAALSQVTSEGAHRGDNAGDDDRGGDRRGVGWVVVAKDGSGGDDRGDFGNLILPVLLLGVDGHQIL